MSTSSPFKFNKNYIYFYGALGFVFAVGILAIMYIAGQALPPIGLVLFVIILIPALFALIGLRVARQAGTIFTFEVDNPVKLNNLIPGHTYWLNGETGARFIGVGSFTGKYHFHIEGYNSATNRDDFTAIFPGNVRKYISMKLEPH